MRTTTCWICRVRACVHIWMADGEVNSDVSTSRRVPPPLSTPHMKKKEGNVQGVIGTKKPET